MPDVRGMGLRDALYLLENEGIKVDFAGAGKVTHQSVHSGQTIVRGMRVTLKLGQS